MKLEEIVSIIDESGDLGALEGKVDDLNGLTIEVIADVKFDENQFSTNEEGMMMQKAMEDIEKSVILIAEVSEKGIGIGIEVGYAKAKNIPVIYVRNSRSEHSTTVSGIADFRIIYENEIDLEEQLDKILKKLSNNLKTTQTTSN